MNKITKFLYQTTVNFILIMGTIILVKFLGMPIIDRSMINAASNGSLSTVKTKLEYLYADVNALNRDGVSALHYAAYQGNVEMAQLLFEYGADVNRANTSGDLPLETAMRHRNYKVVKLMLDKGVNRKSATQALWRLALDNEYIVDQYSKPPVALLIKEELTAKLVALGADVNKSISAAVFSDNLEMLALLIANGADVNYKDKDGKCPIFQAHTARAVDFLVANGADVDCKDKIGYTALFRVSREEAAQAMLKHGADINAISNRGSVPILTNTQVGDFFIKHGANIYIKDDTNGTLLHHPSIVKTKEACYFLIKKGLDVNTKNIYGNTPILVAMSDYTSIDFIKCFLDNGANVNMQNNKGQTALHEPTHDIDKVKLLLEHGVDVNVKDNDGKTPLDIQMTLSNPNKEIVRLLKEYTTKY